MTDRSIAELLEVIAHHPGPRHLPDMTATERAALEAHLGMPAERAIRAP